MFARPIAGLALVLALALTATACSAAPDQPPPSQRPGIGLMTTLPLIWGEAADVGELLTSDAPGNWVRQALERRFMLEPLDVLDEASLAALEGLILAQPRALSGQENVALDAWVRRGGTVLLFADPMLTRRSRFPIGDRRRPQDVVLLSPILARWSLTLLFDEEQAQGERIVEIGGVRMPLDMHGRFEVQPGSRCVLAGGGVLAICPIGRGKVVALADAAVLDDEPHSAAIRGRALDRLLQLAFAG